MVRVNISEDLKYLIIEIPSTIGIVFTFSQIVIILVQSNRIFVAMLKTLVYSV